MSVDTSRGNPSMDYKEHQKTYTLFIRLTKFAVIFLVALLAGMYYFLVR